MIAIINQGPYTDDPGGEREYTLQINDKIMTRFKHKRKHGLAACLRAAAKAWELEELKNHSGEIMEILSTQIKEDICKS